MGTVQVGRQLDLRDPFFCIFFFLWILGTCSAQGSNVFRAGAVLTRQGGHSTEMEEAQNGYKLVEALANAVNGGRGVNIVGRDGVELFFKLNFTSRDDGGLHRRHEQELKDLIEGPSKIHFVFGSHPEFAVEEARISQELGRLNYQCCVGPDTYYEQNLKYVFGIQASNERYSELAIRSMALKGLKKLAVIYRKDNIFTRTTCESAIRLAQERFTKEVGNIEITFTDTFNRTEMRQLTALQQQGANKQQLVKQEMKEHFTSFAKHARQEGVEGVVACAFAEDGRLLVNAFTDQGYPLKSFFLTVGPTKQEWIEGTNNSAYLLSAVQWHEAMKDIQEDPLFGTPGDYADKYRLFYGKDPTYVSAGASAVGYTLMLAINETFSNCDIGASSGDVDDLLFGPSLSCADNKSVPGYERVRRALAQLDVPTFFGHVRFNQNRRNVGKQPATTQVLGPTNECINIEKGELNVEVVLPLELANRELKMPACNHFRGMCHAGFFVPDDAFLPCLPCNIGSFSAGDNADHCDACPRNRYNNETGQSDCRRCPENTFSERNQTSITNCTCIPGFFEPRGQKGKDCIECPRGAECLGGEDRPVPKKGYWVDKNADEITEVYECPVRSACVGEGNCTDGHTGRLCNSCEEGYFSVFDRCFKCLSKWIMGVFFVVLAVGWYVLNVTISKNLASLEMILSWAQLANVIGDVDLRWPPILEVVFGVADLMDFDVDIIQPTCFKATWTYEENFFVQLCLPFIMGSIALMGYIIARALKTVSKNPETLQFRILQHFSYLQRVPRDQAELNAKWDMTVAAFLSSVEVTYITITKYCFDAYKCEDIHGISVLSAAPDIECETKKHDIIRGLGAVGILGYVIGYPVFVCWRLYSLKRGQAFADPVNLRRYGFLYRRFELDYFWTGLVVLIRRMFFVLVLISSNNAAFQAGILSAIIIMSLMIHVYTAPYVDTYLDWLFSVLLISLLMECFGGLMFYAENLPDVNRMVLEWFVLSGLMLLIIMFALTFSREMMQKYEILSLRRLHCRAILNRPFLHDDGEDGLKQLKTHESEVSWELLYTFDPHFLYGALKNADADMMSRWDKLSDMLKDYMADQSETSYLSLKPVASFWRKLVERFPELIDFLAVADESTREDFKSFVTKLYKDFYLKKKLERLPIFRVLNWRDRAPMAQWLAMAQEEDLVFFRQLMVDLYKSAQCEEVAHLIESKVREQGRHDVKGVENVFGGSKVGRLCGLDKFARVVSTNKAFILEEISEKRGPLRHNAQKQIIAQAMVATAAVKFKAGSQRRILPGADGLKPFAGSVYSTQPLDGLNGLKWGNQSPKRNVGQISGQVTDTQRAKAQTPDRAHRDVTSSGSKQGQCGNASINGKVGDQGRWAQTPDTGCGPSDSGQKMNSRLGFLKGLRVLQEWGNSLHKDDEEINSKRSTGAVGDKATGETVGQSMNPFERARVREEDSNNSGNLMLTVHVDGPKYAGRFGDSVPPR